MKSDKTNKASPFQRYQTHAVLLVLAWVIWFLVNQAVEVEEAVPDIASLDIELDLGEGLSDSWAVYSVPSSRYSLQLKGPREEINSAVESLGRLERGAIFRALVDEQAFERASIDEAKQTRTIKLPLSSFKKVVPTQDFREVTMSFEDETRQVEVVIEEIVERNARIEVDQDSFKGLENYEEELSFNKNAVLRGAASKFTEMKRDTSGIYIVPLKHIDLSGVSDPQIERTKRVRIELPSGLSLRDEEGARLNEVDVNIAFHASGDLNSETVLSPIGVRLARWMVKAEVRVIMPEGFEAVAVQLKVTQETKDKYFRDERDVRVEYDLSHLSKEDIKEFTREEGENYIAEITNAYLSVTLLHRDKMRYEIVQPPGAAEKVTLERFWKDDKTLTLVWRKN